MVVSSSAHVSCVSGENLLPAVGDRVFSTPRAGTSGLHGPWGLPQFPVPSAAGGPVGANEGQRSRTPTVCPAGQGTRGWTCRSLPEESRPGCGPTVCQVLLTALSAGIWGQLSGDRVGTAGTTCAGNSCRNGCGPVEGSPCRAPPGNRLGTFPPMHDGFPQNSRCRAWRCGMRGDIRGILGADGGRILPAPRKDTPASALDAAFPRGNVRVSFTNTPSCRALIPTGRLRQWPELPCTSQLARAAVNVLPKGHLVGTGDKRCRDISTGKRPCRGFLGLCLVSIRFQAPPGTPHGAPLVPAFLRLPLFSVTTAAVGRAGHVCCRFCPRRMVPDASLIFRPRS